VKRPTDLFATGIGIVLAGLAVGCLAATLQKLGNPANMGVCVACFTRDIVGALGLHRAGVVQYLRPEIPAFGLGAFIAALAFREFRPRTGSAPIVRFVLGMFAMIGALIFLGCPWRALLRLAGGDWNAVLGIAGLIVGIALGVAFLRGGFNLGRSYPTRAVAGLAMPLLMLVLLVLAILYPQFGDEGTAALFRTAVPPNAGKVPPGAAAAPVIWSTIIGLIVGFLAQRTRFCTVGGIRDVILMRDFHLLSGVAAFLVAAFVLNLIYGQFRPGFAGQPAAHTTHWLNFTGMVLAGLSFTLAGGCPGRQVFLSGEGDGDAAVFVLGMMFGAAVSHNFVLVGAAPNAAYIVVIGLAVVVTVGFLGREKPAAAR
jgi:YedE family putative selenium metabolism protein